MCVKTNYKLSRIFVFCHLIRALSEVQFHINLKAETADIKDLA